MIVVIIILLGTILHITVLNLNSPLKEAFFFIATFILYLQFMPIATRCVPVTTAASGLVPFPDVWTEGPKGPDRR